MKIVINKCFGGFNLSAEALKQLVLRNAKCIESMTPKSYYGGDNEKYRSWAEWEKRWLDDFKNYEDIGDGFMTDKAWPHNVLKDDLLYSFTGRSESTLRADIDLVAVVESLGDKASGPCSELKVVEIPDGVDFVIDEYDGLEHVAETHRVWNRVWN